MAQINEFNEKYQEVESFELVIANYAGIWKKIFSLAKSVDMKKPLTIKILSDPNHDFVKTILYIYSM